MRDRLKQFNENEIRLAKSRTAALLEGQELERRRITLDLHDGVGQLLTAIRMRVELVEGNEERKKESWRSLTKQLLKCDGYRTMSCRRRLSTTA